MSRCPDAQDRLERWQTFLIDGFEDWLPAATIAAGALVDAKPRQVLSGMLYDFYYPEGVQQSTNEIVGFLEQWAARANAIVKDKDGKVIGRMKDGQAKPKKPKPSATTTKPKPRRAQKRTAKGEPT